MLSTQTSPKITNSVLTPNRKISQNFYQSDRILQHFIQKNTSEKGLSYMLPKYHELGKAAATIMDELSMLADHKGPELIKRNAYGETINEIRFHPAYWQLMDIAARSEIFHIKWQPKLRQQFQSELHRLSFVQHQLFSMGEMGIGCPMAMTDGVALLIDKYGDAADKARLLPGLGAKEGAKLLTGAMFLTEKAGGSDVGRNLVTATQVSGDRYHLNGEKWFCSNVNADVIFVLARTNPDISGTRGLSIFLVEKCLADGSRNPMDIVRIKDKLGVRSMASGECMLQNTVGKLYGKEGQGMKIMLDMIALMRVYNSVSAIAGERRALVEAWQHLKYRTVFGKNALEHALIRDKFHELCAKYIADFYLTWHTVHTLDKADNGKPEAQALVRLLTPMAKYQTGINTVYVTRECMELMGGMGYIEDTVMPKLFRDVLVLPIWEGAGNVMILDMLRASGKSPDSLPLLLKKINETASQHPAFTDMLLTESQSLHFLFKKMVTATRDQAESTAKPLFNRLIRLYQITLLLHYRDSESEAWIDPALEYLVRALKKETLELRTPLSIEKVEDLMAWKIDCL